MEDLTIKIIRGDSDIEALTVKDENKNVVELQTGDVLILTARKSIKGDVLITKTINGPNNRFEFSPSDTDLEPGTYIYDIELTLKDGFRKTIINRQPFIIEEGATKHES